MDKITIIDIKNNVTIQGTGYNGFPKYHSSAFPCCCDLGFSPSTEAWQENEIHVC